MRYFSRDSIDEGVEVPLACPTCGDDRLLFQGLVPDSSAVVVVGLCRSCRHHLRIKLSMV